MVLEPITIDTNTTLEAVSKYKDGINCSYLI